MFLEFGRKFLLALLVFSFMLFPVCVSASEPNEGEGIFDEQQSVGDDIADDAYDSVTDKLDPDNIYDSVMNQVNKNKDKNFFKSLLKGFYSAYSYLRSLAPVIGIIGTTVGVIIAVFARKNKGLRRFGITIAIMVPVLLIFIVFGIGYLNSVFLYD